ncbi:hypothetical protein EYC84_005542 [Monilinia fructicola]|uniref:Uncharacterized protein n=1 Tax=Monilinia fructicola TaxID=38448 RepID=A0A5M9K5B4_MONFR|nr:hypothetical protein EYC84_005542 [Monilinia fructicola]
MNTRPRTPTLIVTPTFPIPDPKPLDNLRQPGALFFPPLSTLTKYINGAGSPTRRAKNQKAGLISPVRSTIAPTIAGPNTLDPLSVIA